MFKYLVVAGDYHQFMKWLNDNKISPLDARYISNENILKAYEEHCDDITLVLGPGHKDHEVNDSDLLNDLLAAQKKRIKKLKRNKDRN